MNICEAVIQMQRSGRKIRVRRDEWPNATDHTLVLDSTGGVAITTGISVSPYRVWMPKADDLSADDWMIEPES